MGYLCFPFERDKGYMQVRSVIAQKNIFLGFYLIACFSGDHFHTV